MPLWRKKRKGGEEPGDWEREGPFDDPFFSVRDDIFRDMDKHMEQMQAYMNAMMEKAARGELEPGRNGDPYVYGWSMRVGPDGVPHVQKFGNMAPDRLPPGLMGGDEREPVRKAREGMPGSDGPLGSEGCESGECETCAQEPLASPNVREPLTDICEDENNVVITAEMPGIEKDSIELETSDDSMVIKVEKGNRKYYKDVTLPARVKPSTAKARYNNGVLDVTVEKSEPKKGGRNVKVE